MQVFISIINIILLQVALALILLIIRRLLIAAVTLQALSAMFPLYTNFQRLLVFSFVFLFLSILIQLFTLVVNFPRQQVLPARSSSSFVNLSRSALVLLFSRFIQILMYSTSSNNSNSSFSSFVLLKYLFLSLLNVTSCV